MPFHYGDLVKIAEDTYEVVFRDSHQGKSLAPTIVPLKDRDPNKRYCSCGKVLRRNNRTGLCRACVLKIGRRKCSPSSSDR
jgi:hypothetical protein